jgi:hypothetical protein
VKALVNEQWLRAYPMKLIRVSPPTGVVFRDERIYLYRQTDPAVLRFVQNYLQIDKMAVRLSFTPVNAWGKK